MFKQASSFVATVAVASAASAGVTYGFTGITNNKAGDVAIGQAQFLVELNEGPSNTVQFLFTNTGPSAASMVQLYWEDSQNILKSLKSWSTTTASKNTPNYGVNFGGGSASPGHLPGSSPKINDFSIQAKSQGGKSKNGVGTGEDVSIFFSFAGSYTALLEAMDSGDIKVGIHAQAFASGGSESFVSTPHTPPTGVPSPTAALAGMGLLGLIAARRRRRN